MKIIVANWKMNKNFDEADEWLNGFFAGYAKNPTKLQDVEIVLCPPAVLAEYIDSELMEEVFKDLEVFAKSENKTIEDFSEEELSQILIEQRAIMLGAQDCHYEKSGSFTGDVSAAVLRQSGCEYVILGHSERRSGHSEASNIVRKKVEAAIKEQMVPIVCVGESAEIRTQGQHSDFVLNQIFESLPQNLEIPKLIIAYEPVWSIGTGVTPTEKEIHDMLRVIRIFCEKNFSSHVKEFFLLYGGSTTSQNSKEILLIDGIDGLLVGKASLDAEEFFKICLSSAS